MQRRNGSAARLERLGNTLRSRGADEVEEDRDAFQPQPAEVFAAQLRAYLRREFDEEWWRSSRAASFIKDELWRPGRRHTAEEILGFMGYAEGFDPAILAAEFEEVLRPI